MGMMWPARFRGVGAVPAQDLEQLCHTVGWRGCLTQSHGEGKVSKVPIGNLEIPGWMQGHDYLLFMPEL